MCVVSCALLLLPNPKPDTLLATQTVYETVQFSARLRTTIPPTAAAAADPELYLHRKVERVLHDLGLLHVADSRVGNAAKGGISSGERKRLQLAVELVTDPLLLFADGMLLCAVGCGCAFGVRWGEVFRHSSNNICFVFVCLSVCLFVCLCVVPPLSPNPTPRPAPHRAAPRRIAPHRIAPRRAEPTSGLDSFNANLLMSVLKRHAARRGLAVITSIHQPPANTWHCFDKVLLLTRRGEMAYSGPTAQAVAYLSGPFVALSVSPVHSWLTM
jgi:hypothetical protein